MRKVWRVVAGSKTSPGESRASISPSTTRTEASSCRARSVGTMRCLSLIRSGSSKISRSRFSAVLTAGCDWFRRVAARETLRSFIRMLKTRSR